MANLAFLVGIGFFALGVILGHAGPVSAQMRNLLVDEVVDPLEIVRIVAGEAMDVVSDTDSPVEFPGTVFHFHRGIVLRDHPV